MYMYQIIMLCTLNHINYISITLEKFSKKYSWKGEKIMIVSKKKKKHTEINIQQNTEINIQQKY